MLQTMFGRLQVLRQNTLVAAPADPNMQPVKIQPPEGMEVIPADLVQRIPEFRTTPTPSATSSPTVAENAAPGRRFLL